MNFGGLSASDRREASGDVVHGEPRGIAVAAQVTENDVFKRGIQLRQHLCGGGIGEMTVPGENALFHRPRPLGIFLQQFLVVIGLDQQGPNAAQAV